MKKMIWQLLLVLMLGVVACQGGTTEESNTNDSPATALEPTTEATPTTETELTMNLNEPFVLPAGETVTVTAAALRITFTNVVEDSRCPTQVNCFWTGRAVVEMAVQQGDAASQTITFDTNPAPTELRDTIVVNGYSIHLERLDPYPELPDEDNPDHPIAFETYTATLIVSEEIEEPVVTEPAPLPTQAVMTQEATLNEPFILTGGQEVVLAEFNLRLAFTSVLEDSRCPKQVDCFWSGRIIIEIEVQQGENAPQKIALQTSTAPSETADTVDVMGYTIHLANVDPYPDNPDVAITFEEYQATLVVTETSDAPAATEPAPQTPIEQEGRLGESFVLGGGQTIVIADAGLQLTFTQVVEDSRCPTQVSCVWSGQVIIAIEMRDAAAATQTITLQTSTSESLRMDTVEVMGYTLHLETVDPYPNDPDVMIPFESYQATLTVSQ